MKEGLPASDGREAALLPVAASLSLLRGPDRPDLCRDESLADIFEATARRLPDKVALIFGEEQLTYGALDARAGRVAACLRQAGVGPGQIVGLWLPRGSEALVMQLGIAKTGAAWLPLDAQTPPERVQDCLADAGAVGLLCDADRQKEFTVSGGDVLTTPIRCWTPEVLVAAEAETVQEIPAEPHPRAQGHHPAYVIYTSGSTGKPKGIVIHQAAIAHFLRSENTLLGVREEDRVYQGFSLAFDMSFEEIWISYLVGATLWIAPQTLTGDAESLPQVLTEQRMTVLHAVPTLLALFDRDIPGLRLINLGGEACPEALAARWIRPGRQVFNTYGPTEATVSASLAELQAGVAVTIGQPLPNYGLLVIDPVVEHGLRLLPRGETGELCIIGPGVSAGYPGRAQLTAEKFPANPWATGAQDARLYRTGDLACIDEAGNVRCLGRTDDQVKIRGFRVELGEIEAALSRQPGVATAAVLLRQDEGLERLVAYLVGQGADAVSLPGLRTALAATLPPYMVPGHFEWLDAMPRLASGKIDRNTLRTRPLQPAAQTMQDGMTGDVPETAAETVLFAELAKLFPGQPIRRSDDFFADLGGHSLLAARLISALRNHPEFAGFMVRDLYQQRSIGQIAVALSASASLSLSSPPSPAVTWTPPSALRRWRCGLAQALAVPVLVVLRMAQWLAPFFTYHYMTGDPGDSIPRAIAVSVGVFLLATLFEFVIAIASKWLILGRLKPGRYPLWGWVHFRWWLVDRLIEAAPAYMLSGSPLHVWWLRALGSRIGREVVLGSLTLRAHDLLQIGDGVSVGNAVNLENVRVEQGELRVGTITLADAACIGSYAVLEGNTAVEAGGHLDGQSSLAEGGRVLAGRRYSGSPACDVGAFVAESPPAPAVSWGQRGVEHGFFFTGTLLTAILFFIPVFPSFILVDWLDVHYPWGMDSNVMLQLLKYFTLAFPGTAVLVVCTVLFSAALRWSLLPRLQAGNWPVHGKVYCSRWLVNQIQEASLNVLHGVYATVFAPGWYRLLGAKVGRDAEISTAQGLIPDLLTLGDETFIADAVMLGDEEVDGGWMSLRPTTIGRRSFVGNGAYVPDGTTLPENVLIGVHTRAPASEEMHPGETWLGTPPILLPAREQLQGFPESLTFRPSRLRRLGRGLVEAFRIITPHATVIAVGYTVVLNLMPSAGEGRWSMVLWFLMLAGLLYGLGTFLLLALFKWLLIGRYDTRAQPMWTAFVWLTEAITNLYEGIVVPNFMRYLRGTPWLPLAFNLLGSRIGRGVYLDTTDFTEFDCVHIGEDSEVNALSCPQTHLFEDRVMKIDHVRIGRRVTLRPRCAVLYSAQVADGVQLGPLTLVMKGEQLPPDSAWHGCPAAPMARGAA